MFKHLQPDHRNQISYFTSGYFSEGFKFQVDRFISEAYKNQKEWKTTA